MVEIRGKKGGKRTGIHTTPVPRGTSTKDGYSLRWEQPQMLYRHFCGLRVSTDDTPPPRLHKMETKHALSASPVKTSSSQEQRWETITCSVSVIEAAAANVLRFGQIQAVLFPLWSPPHPPSALISFDEVGNNLNNRYKARGHRP